MGRLQTQCRKGRVRVRAEIRQPEAGAGDMGAAPGPRSGASRHPDRRDPARDGFP